MRDAFVYGTINRKHRREAINFVGSSFFYQILVKQIPLKSDMYKKIKFTKKLYSNVSFILFRKHKIF
jgi:hypothetical protein